MKNATLCAPADFVVAIPLILGFSPRHSAVVVALGPSDDIRLVARCDLPATGESSPPPESLVHAVARAVPGGAALLVCFDEERARAESVTAVLAECLAAKGVAVRDRLLVRGSRWQSLDEGGIGEGHPIDPERAEEIRQTLGVDSPAADRSELVAELDPLSSEEQEEVSSYLNGLPAPEEACRDHCINVAQEVLRRGNPSAHEVASVLRAVRDMRVRDTLLWDVLHEAPSTWGTYADSLSRVVRLAPEEEMAPAATLLAILRWQTGDGARALIALDRGLAVEPGYSLANLVAALVCGGYDPREWREGLESLSRDACRGAETRSGEG